MCSDRTRLTSATASSRNYPRVQLSETGTTLVRTSLLQKGCTGEAPPAHAQQRIAQHSKQHQTFRKSITHSERSQQYIHMGVFFSPQLPKQSTKYNRETFKSARNAFPSPPSPPHLESSPGRSPRAPHYTRALPGPERSQRTAAAPQPPRNPRASLTACVRRR